MNKRVKTSDVVLAVAVILLILFTVRIINLIETIGYEPSTLITAVFAAALGEFGIMGWIKTTKTRHGNSDSTSDDTEGVG